MKVKFLCAALAVAQVRMSQLLHLRMNAVVEITMMIVMMMMMITFTWALFQSLNHLSKFMAILSLILSKAPVSPFLNLKSRFRLLDPDLTQAMNKQPLMLHHGLLMLPHLTQMLVMKISTPLS